MWTAPVGKMATISGQCYYVQVFQILVTGQAPCLLTSGGPFDHLGCMRLDLTWSCPADPQLSFLTTIAIIGVRASNRFYRYWMLLVVVNMRVFNGSMSLQKGWVRRTAPTLAETKADHSQLACTATTSVLQRPKRQGNVISIAGPVSATRAQLAKTWQMNLPLHLKEIHAEVFKETPTQIQHRHCHACDCVTETVTETII